MGGIQIAIKGSEGGQQVARVHSAFWVTRNAELRLLARVGVLLPRVPRKKIDNFTEFTHSGDLVEPRTPPK